MNLDELNKKYKDLSYEERILTLYDDFPPEKVLLTSSFGTTSAFLLHLFSRLRKDQPVHFINTTYLFQETLDYKDELVTMFGLNVVEVKPEDWKNEFTKNDETWTKDPDLCCSINKVEPLEKIKAEYDIWVSGLMGYQSKFRKRLPIFENKRGIIKFYPLIDVTEEQRDAYIAEHKLPFHPLKEEGYASVGCAQCTVKGKNREGRWEGSSKTECGLHL
ncbi:MAG: phosphoadenylyl-sulfate reductase [Flavobacteriales bacterium]|nr:phosphoadenylyl-sulfate reductase [Flavobacteriales bacterium]MCB9446930.1 phosphoadenylyl-sulfate reductase [Flavobacteriales bacterium]